MALSIDLLRTLVNSSSSDAWSQILQCAWNTCVSDLPHSGIANEITRRDRTVGDLDLFLTSVGWDLWSEFDSKTPHAADALVEWWAAQTGGRAVLILDGLSLREVPMILQAASARSFKVLSAAIKTAELPADTNSFAHMLGFSQRSAIENNGAGANHRLPGARTDSVNIPFKDCQKLIGAEPRWLLWHHWPDVQLHQLSTAGHGLDRLAKEVSDQINSDDFWALVSRLAIGRRLLITSDHGYCASGLFSDAPEDQAAHLKNRFKSGRFSPGANGNGPWVPPVSVTLKTRHGTNQYALGRRKWKSQGGYPTLVHGGLSMLEVAVPFIELSRME